MTGVSDRHQPVLGEPVGGVPRRRHRHRPGGLPVRRALLRHPAPAVRPPRRHAGPLCREAEPREGHLHPSGDAAQRPRRPERRAHLHGDHRGSGQAAGRDHQPDPPRSPRHPARPGQEHTSGHGRAHGRLRHRRDALEQPVLARDLRHRLHRGPARRMPGGRVGRRRPPGDRLRRDHARRPRRRRGARAGHPCRDRTRARCRGAIDASLPPGSPWGSPSTSCSPCSPGHDRSRPPPSSASWRRWHCCHPTPGQRSSHRPRRPPERSRDRGSGETGCRRWCR